MIYLQTSHVGIGSFAVQNYVFSGMVMYDGKTLLIYTVLGVLHQWYLEMFRATLPIIA